MKNSFLADIEERMAAVSEDQLSEVSNRLGSRDPDHKQIGVLDDTLQRQYVVLEQLTNEARSAMTDSIADVFAEFIVGSGNMDELVKATRIAKELRARMKAEREFFWASVQAKYDLFGSGALTLAEGWKLMHVDPVCGDCGERHEFDAGALLSKMGIVGIGILEHNGDDPLASELVGEETEEVVTRE